MGQEEGGSLRAEYAYDAAGHRTKSRDGDGVEVSLSYGLEGQIRTLTTERAREAGRITAIHAPEGGKEEYTYDAAGNLRTSKAALGGVVSYTYTSRGAGISLAIQSISSTIRKAGRWCRWTGKATGPKPGLTFMASRYTRHAPTGRESAR